MKAKLFVLAPYVCPSPVVQRFIIGNDYAPYISHRCRTLSWRLHYCVWSG